MIVLSVEQQEIVELPLQPLAVTACAGSGKTMTAVHRLAAMRRLHDDAHGLVVLLSFSNVAVDTFRREYVTSVRNQEATLRSFAVEIDTMDGFITANVLRSHGHRVMECGRTPYLVDGREPFLKSFTVWDGKRSHLTSDININIENNAFSYSVGQNQQPLSPAEAVSKLVKLGKTGAYTHASARYWVLRVLREHPFVLRALARRYPHILVDEAQDIGPEHQAILELLVSQGSQLSLIGDPHQGIYEFAHANGAFLATYGQRAGVLEKYLSINYRSVPSILAVANKLCGRDDSADRSELPGKHGAYYFAFKKTEREKALATFQSILVAVGINSKRGAVLCRSTDWASRWSGEQDGQGQGVIRCFANAAINRDQLKRLPEAYAQSCLGIVGLLASEHGNVMSQLARTSRREMNQLRRMIWSFVRDMDHGLPSAALVADSEWHPKLCDRARKLVAKLESEFGLKSGENLGQKLAKRALENRPLAQIPDLAQPEMPQFRVSTVHKVKGESLQAVMYVADKKHVRELLDGTGSEVGRIGYVAVTRAEDLFVLAVPDSCFGEFESELQAKGLRRAGTTAC